MDNNIISDNDIKRYVADIEPYQNAWSIISNGQYMLGGTSRQSLPPNVYTLDTDFHGNIIFKAIDMKLDKLISMPNSTADYLLNTSKQFWSKKNTYYEFGQVHKMGILLYGQQGQGKSSIINIVFGDLLKSGGIAILVDNPELTLNAINRFRIAEKDRNVILLYEDIEEIISEYGESNILSLLDGQKQFTNVIHMATTNYIDQIPDRLKNRPGRFDYVVKLDPPSTEQRKIFIEHLTEPCTENVDIVKMVNDTKDFSMAHIKELVISTYILEKPYEETLNRLNTMYEKAHHSRRSKCDDPEYRREHPEKCKDK